MEGAASPPPRSWIKLTKYLMNKYCILVRSKYFFEWIRKLFSISTTFYYFRTFTGTNRIFSLQSNRIPEESIKLHLHMTIFTNKKWIQQNHKTKQVKMTNYCSPTRCMINRFKHTFHNSSVLIWSCKVNL